MYKRCDAMAQYLSITVSSFLEYPCVPLVSSFRSSFPSSFRSAATASLCKKEKSLHTFELNRFNAIFDEDAEADDDEAANIT
jgi:hypothetical protein